MKNALHVLIVFVLFVQNLTILQPINGTSFHVLESRNLSTIVEDRSVQAEQLQETVTLTVDTSTPTLPTETDTPVPIEPTPGNVLIETTTPTATAAPPGEVPAEETLTPTPEPTFTPIPTLEQLLPTESDEPQEGTPPEFDTRCAFEKDSPDIRVSANPAIYLPNRPIWLHWIFCSQPIPSEKTALVAILAPKGVQPLRKDLSEWMTPEGWLYLPADIQFDSLAWEVTPDAELPLVFSFQLLVDNVIIDEESLLVSQPHFEINQQGGSIEALGGKVSLQISEAATQTNLAFDVRYPGPQSLPGTSLSWNPVEIIAIDLENGLNVKRFDIPISLQIRYDEKEIVESSEKDLQIFYYNEEHLEWYPVETKVDTENNILTAEIDHFTVFDYKATSWQSYSTPTIDSFQVSQFTGAGTYEMKFWTPPGPAGLQTDLRLTYNSQVIDQGSTFTQASWVGMGWSMEIGSITRNMHGSNSNLDDDTFVLSVAGVSDMLLPIGSGSYKTVNDLFWKIQKDDTNDTWKVWSKDGYIYEFNHRARTHTQNGCVSVPSLNLTWSWSLSKVTDLHGNYNTYTYFNETKTGCENDIAVFPDTITYQNSRYRIQFIREDRGDYNSAWTQNSSTVLYGTKRLKEILIQHNPSGTWSTVRKYSFSYAQNNETTNVILPRFKWNPTGTNALTLTLRSVQEIGGSLSLPATQFSYDDLMHLTKVDNGQGGQVVMEYEIWSYFDDDNDDLRSYFSIFGDHECNPNTDPPPGKINGTIWSAIQWRVRCDLSNHWLQVGESGTLGIGHAILPEHIVKPGAKYEIAVEVRAIPTPPNATDLNFGIYDSSLSSGNQYMIYSDQIPIDIRLVFQYLLGRVTMPVNFNPNTTVMRIEGDNAFVRRIQFSVHPPYYRVTTRDVHDQIKDTDAVYSYAYDNPSPNTSQVSEAVSGGGSLYTPRNREYRGNAMSQIVDPYSLATINWYYQNDYLKGKSYRSITMRQDLYDGFESLNSTWTITGGTQSITALNSPYDYDTALKSTSTQSNWSVAVSSENYTLTDGETAIAHIRLQGAAAQGEVGLVSATNKFFGVLFQIESGQPVARVRYDLGAGMVNDYVLIPSPDMRLDQWYTIMLFADSTNGFRVIIWEMGNPENYSEMIVPGFSNETWKFRNRINTGTLWLDAYSEGKIFTETTYQYESNTSILDIMGYLDLDVVWTPITNTVSRNYDGNASWEGTLVFYDYEQSDQNNIQYGNLTREAYFISDGTMNLVDYAVHTEYWPLNSGNKYLVNLPARQSIIDCNSGCDFTYHSGIIAESLFIYDSNTVYNATPSNGQLTKQRTLMKEVAGQKYYNQVSYGYEYGSIASVTTYPDYTTASADPSGGRTISYDIDDTYQSYVLTETNPLSYSTSFTYDYALGVTTKISGPNHSTTTPEAEGAAYDSLGRLTAICAPIDWDGIEACSPNTSIATLSLSYFNYSGQGSPFGIQLDQKIDNTHTLSILRYFNGLGSLLQAQTLSADLLTGTKNVVIDYQYDLVSRQVRERVPYAYTGSAAFQTQDFMQPSSLTNYDELGRVVQTLRSDGYPETGYAYNGLETIVTDANGHTTRQVRDQLGRVVEVHPQVGPWTGYTYDVLNRLTQASQYIYNTTTQIGVTTIQYDFGGRKISMTDPDMGSWTYTYYANGSLETQTDARSCISSLTYNNLDQLTSKTFSGSCDTTPTVSFTYYNSLVPYSKSRRTAMTDSSGSTAWMYDARGRVLSETKTITGGGTFLTQWTYDSADHIISMTYPGGSSSQAGEIVDTTYLRQGAIDTVTGSATYVHDSLYDEAMRLTQRFLGANAIQTDYEYYPWTTVDGIGRLWTLETTAGSTLLQDFTYQYDAVGNIWHITDALDGPQTQSFIYDEIDRLSTAEVTGGSNGVFTLETYTYDTLGRLSGMPGTGTLSFGSTSQEPTPPLHAVTDASGHYYVYDDNGNLQNKKQNTTTLSTYTYDGENRLTAVSGQDTANFVYDGDGNRVKGTVNGTTTYYLGNYMEFVGGQTTPETASDTLIPYGGHWKYLDIGTEPATGWTGLSYNDNSWKSGKAVLGYGDQHEQTRVSYGPSSTNKYVTTYFRKVFYANSSTLYDSIQISLDYDDGAVVYLNGAEMFRANMPTGGISYSTLASTDIEDTTATHTINLNGQMLAGANVVAVEVHQSAVTSSDLHFNLRLIGNRSIAIPANTLVAAGTIWRYYSTGAEPATGWKGTSFNDSSWLAGASILGYGDAHETTTVYPGPDPNNRYLTSYYRKSFTVTDPSLYSSLDVILEYDDGAVVYLNGVELFRTNLPTGTIAYSTLASTSLEDTLVVYPINPSALVTGTNVLAVEVHQESSSSNDCHFELRMIANQVTGQSVWRKYYYAGGARVAMREGITSTGTTGLSFLLGDHLGSTNVTTNATGQKVSELRYKPWGQVRYSLGTSQTTFRFTGQREEAALDMYYYGARWYDPTLGHFLQADSIVPEPGNPLAWNKYAYTLYNPVRYTDPSGHYIFEQTPDDKKFEAAIPGVTPAIRSAESCEESTEYFLENLQAPFDNYFISTLYRAKCTTTGQSCIGTTGRHMGIDFHSNDSRLEAEKKVVIHSIYDGTVVGITGNEPNNGGIKVIVEHIVYGYKFYSIYLHLNDVHVSLGQKVIGGTDLAFMGNTPDPSSSIHLHLEVRSSAGVLTKSTGIIVPDSNHWWAYTEKDEQTYWINIGSLWGSDQVFQWP